MVGEYDLTNLDRAEPRVALEKLLHLRVKFVVFEPQVAARQHILELAEITHREMDMDINPPRVNPPRSQHQHAPDLFPRTRENPFHEVQHAGELNGELLLREMAIEILHEDHRPRGHLLEIDPHLGNIREPREIKVVYIVAQKLRHGGDEAGLASAERGVEEIAPALDSPKTVVVLVALNEGLEVGPHPVLHLGVHDHRVERPRVGERHEPPPSTTMSEQLSFPSSELDLIRQGFNLLQIQLEHSAPVLAAKLHNETLLW
ncbi:hypothetical protein J5N97_007018 [Dioscorea zingiberensis]|uniref:Uncharacterized protein n=1 Tax=Dioscorea zingiberensis TaxID=325984 RepID=A0A9D5DDV0_9LILI|nr:hypothetical protein J5N97_007018 [Dioscorea zingiberensis]